MKKTKDDLINTYGLNDEQVLVVLDSSKELIVPAGAGSGKTKTLVTKVVNLLTEGKSLDNFLVLTFTKKAANEMKERIKKELIKANLGNMANKIDSSNISTFDAFAYNFVKQNASLIGLDSNIELLDGIFFNQIKKDILDEIFTDIMLNEERNPSLYNFVRTYTDKQSEDSLKGDFLSTYNNLCELGKIKDLKLNTLIDDSNYFDSLMLSEELADISLSFIEENQELVDFYLDYYDYLNGKDIERPVIKKTIIKWKDLNLTKDQESMIKKLINYPKELYKNDVTINDVIVFKKETFNTLKIILDILVIYEEKLNDFKKLTNKYEFNDIANFLNQILNENEGLLKRQKDKFLYVFVDEYQDTSKVQSDFLEMLIKDNEKINVLYVGDIKQSIYKFRNAKPETFKNKLETIKSIPLKANYRSSSSIIDFVNKLFKEILDDKDKYDIDYKDNHYMESRSTKFLGNRFANVYLEELNTSEDKRTSNNQMIEEAFSVGRKIKELLDNKAINSYKEVAILARNKKSFETFKNVFKYLDIPLQIQVDQKLKQTYFLKLMANVLKLSSLIDEENSEKRFYYFSVARSELFGFSDYNLFNSLTKVVDNKLNSKLEIDDLIYEKCLLLNRVIYTKSNYEIIDDMVHIFDMYKKISKTTKVKEKEYQIEYLYNISKTLSDLNITELDFVEYIYNLAYNDDLNLEISILQDSKEDSVKITNIHQSKGLEYETLFVVGLNNEFNSSLVRNFNYNNVVKFNLNLKSSSDIKTLKINDSVKNSKISKTLKDNLKEELRLLYVALTRAEKALYLVLTPKDDYSKLNSFADYLYSNGLYDFISPLNITRYSKSLSNAEYYLKLKEENTYYPLELDKLEEINFEIESQVIESSKASITINELIDDGLKHNLKQGILMHESFEYENINDKFYLNFKNNLFNGKKLSDAKIYHEYEYEYIDKNVSVKGIIDMVALYKDEVHIIDYKLKNNDPVKYRDQLLNYKKYLSKIFELPILMFVYSIVDNKLSEVV
ncbi:UvrD-helicase domain-containing protein [Haploplasma modicum]|uniref:UvrD-helicase domain-containing protein n=1 Tax=Haploplasma modicum TaxID=2150 RepID=UPI00214D0117|nr:UvrD-helicase domain-containing protein [Haploplasma modicum]MCR1809422.1 UvrD-helicase domain-containing protein [Haploplasma modicum]